MRERERERERERGRERVKEGISFNPDLRKLIQRSKMLPIEV